MVEEKEEEGDEEEVKEERIWGIDDETRGETGSINICDSNFPTLTVFKREKGSCR